MGMVVVHGGAHLDPWTLKCYLQRFEETRHSRHGGGGSWKWGVTVASDGGRPQRSHFEGIVHMKPTLPPPPPYYGRPRWF
jgi:hypothetical protein